jgi:hypothetical protein
VCFIDRHLLQEVSEELQTAFQAVMRVVNYVKNSPLRGKNLCKAMKRCEGKHTELLYCCEVCFAYAKVLHKIFDLKEEIAFLLSDSINSDDANLCYSRLYTETGLFGRHL